MKKRILLLLAEGFEEIEMTVPADVWRRLGFEVIIASIGGELKVKGAHEINIVADTLLENIDVLSFDAVFLPGGMPGSVNLKESARVMELLKKANAAGKVISAICAAPMALANAGIIKGKKVTAYPGTEKHLADSIYTGSRAEADGNIVTGKGAGPAFEFAAKVAESLGKKQEVGELYKNMMVTA